jgi:hypothetical protein
VKTNEVNCCQLIKAKNYKSIYGRNIFFRVFHTPPPLQTLLKSIKMTFKFENVNFEFAGSKSTYGNREGTGPLWEKPVHRPATSVDPEQYFAGRKPHPIHPVDSIALKL